MSKRTQLIVDFDTQGVVVRKALLHWIIFTGSALVISGIIQYCSNPFEGLRENAVGSLRMFAPVLLTLLCLGPVFIYDFLKLSNRIFGPIPRIRNTIRDLSEGADVSELTARKNDIHQSMVEDVNLLINIVTESRKNKTEKPSENGETREAKEMRTETSNRNRSASDEELLEEISLLRAVVRKLTEEPVRKSRKTEEAVDKTEE